MSKIVAVNIARAMHTLAVDLAWTQWSSLSSLASPGTAPARAMVDPEALILLSLMAAPTERRLLDVLTAWTEQGVRLISTQRARSLAKRLPESRKDAFTQFAAIATAAGDHRWKAYTTLDADVYAASSRDKAMGPLRVDSPPALMLRLRAGFGAGTKADVLAMLLGLDGQPVTLRSLSDGLNYGVRALRTAIEDMAGAGFIERINSGPATFRATPSQWEVALNSGRHEVVSTTAFPPRWAFWADTVMFIAHVVDWAEKAGAAKWSEYVAKSRARDVVERHLSPAMIRTMSLRPDEAQGDQKDVRSFERLVAALDRAVRTSW